ncbi:MAG: YihA family ribosome biogenesis GTP-binding protein, partial [Gammaproteobacteria bacterium]|nr:YihA family ribosome biogenesis GTP-binding protein [Gammaproteobacteria bacterium]
SIAKKLTWQKQMEKYLEHRHSLVALVLMVDSRHPLQEFDQMMLDWAHSYSMRCHILLTKADKLSRNAAKQALFTVQKAIKNQAAASVQLFSATSDEGLDAARAEIYAQLHRSTDNPAEPA